MDRLLTDEEIHDAWCSFEGRNITDKMHNVFFVTDGERAIAQASQVKTLKAVGEWLEEYHEYPHNASGEPVVTMRKANCPECLWQLKQGELPQTPE